MQSAGIQLISACSRFPGDALGSERCQVPPVCTGILPLSGYNGIRML